MQTVPTRMVLTNAYVKWDTPAMDTQAQVMLKMTLLILIIEPKGAAVKICFTFTSYS